MKNMNKLFAMVLAVVMVLTLATTAFAADNEGTVVNDTDRTYNAYQIFSGTQADGSAELGDIAWGTGIDNANFLNALKTLEVNSSTPFASCTDAASVAAALTNDNAKAFANLAAKHLGTVAATVAANETKTLASGYYLLVDTSSGNAAQNPALLQVTNGSALKITDKSGAPSVDKTITDEGEAAEGSIGDTFTFELTATMPSTFEGYDTYKVQFVDTMSKGLTFVKFTEVPTGFTTDVQVNTDTGITTITVTDTDVLDDGVKAGDKLVVKYEAVVNAGAVIGSAGNPNEVYLKYSNDPNWNGEGAPTKDTPKDEVKVFTFELDVTKVDGSTPTTKLPGAEFVLLNSDRTKVATVEEGKLTGWVDVPGEGEAWPAKTTLTSGDDGKFVIKGLDQGTYYLKETKAPAGYNLLNSEVKIVITATVTDSEDTQALTGLTISVNDGTAENGTIETGVVSTTVQNNQGSTLPETGGMGTTLFYIFGGVMAAGAAVLLVTKKRMASAE